MNGAHSFTEGSDCHKENTNSETAYAPHRRMVWYRVAKWILITGCILVMAAVLVVLGWVGCR